MGSQKKARGRNSVLRGPTHENALAFPAKVGKADFNVAVTSDLEALSSHPVHLWASGHFVLGVGFSDK